MKTKFSDPLIFFQVFEQSCVVNPNQPYCGSLFGGTHKPEPPLACGTQTHPLPQSGLKPGAGIQMKIFGQLAPEFGCLSYVDIVFQSFHRLQARLRKSLKEETLSTILYSLS